MKCGTVGPNQFLPIADILPRVHRDDLLAYLRPFAQEGKVVSEEDVTAFFEALKEGKKGDAAV